MSLLSRWMTKLPKKPDSVSEARDYPVPIIEDWIGTDQPKDWRLRDVLQQAYGGWFYCQKAVVALSLIHPYTLYRPVIHDEFRESFKASYETHQPMPLTLYERNGKLIMSDDYEAYWLYREMGAIDANCIIVGYFTKVVGLEIYDRPFMLEDPKAHP